MSNIVDGAAIPALPHLAAPLYKTILRKLLARLTHGRLRVIAPDGAILEQRGQSPGPTAILVLHRWRVLRRLLIGGHLGFGEAYVDGDWSSPDVAALLELAACNDDSLAPSSAGALPTRLINRVLHRLRDNTLAGSRRNIVEHYDLGNDFYALWLDRGMTYSSALYRNAEMTLEEAQTAKQDRIIELMRVTGGETVLEIGCGWGGLAHRLAAIGCRVTGLTLSPAQRDHATALLAAAGLSDRVALRLEDYREVSGRFDRIVSIEMLEAVGEAYWPIYFERLRALLGPGGIAVLQVITIANDRVAAYRRCPDFIQRHVFPGGMLPSPAALEAEIARAGLTLEDVETFGEGYARTLREWRQRFAHTLPCVQTLGFSERFCRLWDYYLAYSEAGFRTAAIDVGLWQLRA